MLDTTAIVPLDLALRPTDLIRKACRLARQAELSNMKVIFGHNDRGTIFDKLFKILIKRNKAVRIASENWQSNHINTSHLRNAAFSLVETKYLVLLDADIWPDLSVINKYINKVKKGERAYYFLPCLYLTEKGSNDLAKSRISTADLAKRFYSFSRKEFLHLASPSSITVMKTSDYEEIKGFNADFCGHGYEDFDFMMRLSTHHNLLNPAPDILLDKTARSPLFAVGFRRYLGEQCLDALLEKDMVFHIHHERPKYSEYYTARKKNYARFSELHAFRAEGDSPGEPTLISRFAQACHERHLDIAEYSILFDNKPGHIDRFDTFRRRARFLLND